MTENHAPNQRTYGCTFGCGNPFDFIVVSIADNTVELLCVPCYVKLAADMIGAITDPDNPEIMAKLQMVANDNVEPVPGPGAAPRGHNAPAGTDDPAIFQAYDRVITVDDLPDEFR